MLPHSCLTWKPLLITTTLCCLKTKKKPHKPKPDINLYGTSLHKYLSMCNVEKSILLYQQDQFLGVTKKINVFKQTKSK